MQYPALNEEFNIRAMTIDMCNRSTFDELMYYIVNYLLTECKQQSNNNDDDNYGNDIDNINESRQQREVYLMGESFGGLLAIEVALELQRPSYMNYGIELCGLTLVNPATSYLRSNLYRIAPSIVQQNNNDSNRLFIIDDLRYTIALFTRLIPLFTDKGQSLRQLYTILSSHGLPSVINTPAREAYMGRVAFTLFDRIAFMPIDTLRWRLDEWLEWGASIFEDRLDMLTAVRLSTTTTTTTTAAASTTTTTTATNDNNNNNHTTAAPSQITNDRIVIDNYSLLKISQELRTLIIVGEYDNTLPSVEEATRLSNELFRSSVIHVVPNAGHASTCGGSLNLMRVLREVFPELNTDNNYNVDDERRRRRQRQQSSSSSSSRIGDENTPTRELYGLVSRYDNAWIGLNPLLYWSKEYYRKCDRRKGRR
jgi:pimeloyl-ACP methyl ester carboxylesterase